MERKRVNHQFPEILDSCSKILILGSVPSVKSREYNFYYMNKQNRFWKLLAKIYHTDFENDDIEIKKSLLINHNIALYDVIEECDILGSSDSSIVHVKPAKIDELIRNTKIKYIYLNGKKAYNLFIKFNPNLKDLAICLPSTSPANARFSFDDLYKEWQIISN